MERIEVHYETGAAEFARELVGRDFSDEELALAVGALDGSKLQVRIRKGVELAIEVENERVLEQTRFLRRDADGDLCIWNFRLEKAPGVYGVGLESLLRQIRGARALEVRRIECWAAGNPKDTRYTGYFRWAVYGFDAPLTQSEKEVLWQDPRFAEVVSLNDLVLRGGKDWWRRRGSERKMVFVPDEQSNMMVVLRAYLAENHPHLLGELS